MRKNATVFQKTVAINDFYFRGPHTPYPLGHVQSQGRTHGVMAQTVVPQVPLSWYEWWVARGVDWLAMSEDLPDTDNRVTLDSQGRIQLLYRPNNLKAHQMLVKEMRRVLYKLGFWIVMTHSHGAKNTTHQCGTVVFGDDPRDVRAGSVLPRARRGESVRGRRVVLPFVRRRQSGVDDCGAGAARRRSHSRGRPVRRRSPDSRELWREETVLKARSFSHAGITVSDFNKAVRFYWEMFGCPLVGVADTPPDRVRTFFGVGHDAPTCKIGWIRVPGGGVLEIFEFQPQLAPGPVPWNGVGLTHISFNVKKSAEVARPSAVEGSGDRQQAGAIAARPFVLLRQGLRREPDRADGSRLHVSRAQLVRPAGRVVVPARNVSEVLRK